MKKNMGKLQALKTARERVSGLYAFGVGWRFSVYDASIGVWFKSPPVRYAEAQSLRRAKLVSLALELYGVDKSTAKSKVLEWSECKGGARTIFNEILRELEIKHSQITKGMSERRRA